MLKDINDRPQDANKLAKLLGSRTAGLILFLIINPELDLASALMLALMHSNVDFSKVVLWLPWKTRGDDINAACGQLFGQVTKHNKDIIIIFTEKTSCKISYAYDVLLTFIATRLCRTPISHLLHCGGQAVAWLAITVNHSCGILKMCAPLHTTKNLD